MKIIVFVLAIVTLISASHAAKPLTITKATYGDDWPFTVETGQIACEKGAAAIFISAGKKYALNGTAKSLGYADPNPIWTVDPKLKAYPMIDKNGKRSYTKVSLAPIIVVAKKQC